MRYAIAGAALAAGVLATAASTGASTPRAHAAATAHVIEHAITDKENISLGGKDAKGNVLTFNNPVYDAADRKRVGRDEGYCIRIAPAQGIWDCQWTTFLPRGQVTVAGPFYDTRNSVLSVIGGTGAYRHSRGQMQLKSRHGGTEYDFIFQLG